MYVPCSITTYKEVDVYSCDGNFGWGEQAPLHVFFCAALLHLMVTRRVAHGDFYKAKVSGACISLRGGVRIILHMVE